MVSSCAEEGGPILQLILLAVQERMPAPIPFLVDERIRHGRYVLTAGRLAGTDAEGRVIYLSNVQIQQYLRPRDLKARPGEKAQTLW